MNQKTSGLRMRNKQQRHQVQGEPPNTSSDFLEGRLLLPFGVAFAML